MDFDLRVVGRISTLALVALCGCVDMSQFDPQDDPGGVGPQSQCDMVWPLLDAYVLREDRAPGNWEPTTMNPDCGLLPVELPDGCDEIGPRYSWDGPRTQCFIHIDYDCHGRDAGAEWYTVAAGVDGIVVGADGCGWQVFFDGWRR